MSEQTADNVANIEGISRDDLASRVSLCDNAWFSSWLAQGADSAPIHDSKYYERGNKPGHVTERLTAELPKVEPALDVQDPDNALDQNKNGPATGFSMEFPLR